MPGNIRSLPAWKSAHQRRTRRKLSLRPSRSSATTVNVRSIPPWGQPFGEGHDVLQSAHHFDIQTRAARRWSEHDIIDQAAQDVAACALGGGVMREGGGDVLHRFAVAVDDRWAQDDRVLGLAFADLGDQLIALGASGMKRGEQLGNSSAIVGDDRHQAIDLGGELIDLIALGAFCLAVTLLEL